jgi:hypothetical protein
MSPSSRSFRIPELSQTQQHIAREMKARGNKCLTCEKPSFVVLMSLWAIHIYLLPPFSLEILFNNGGPTECWLETSTTKLCEQMEIVLSLCSCWFWFRSTIAKPSWWLIYQHAATGRNVFANSHRTYFHKGFVSWSIILPSLCRFASRCWFWKALTFSTIFGRFAKYTKNWGYMYVPRPESWLLLCHKLIPMISFVVYLFLNNFLWTIWWQLDTKYLKLW